MDEVKYNKATIVFNDLIKKQKDEDVKAVLERVQDLWAENENDFYDRFEIS
jgi:hypothetical protein